MRSPDHGIITCQFFFDRLNVPLFYQHGFEKYPSPDMFGIVIKSEKIGYAYYIEFTDIDASEHHNY